MIVEPRFRFRGSDVADLLDQWVAAHGAPETITVDHGTEFPSKSAGNVGLKDLYDRFRSMDRVGLARSSNRLIEVT